MSSTYPTTSFSRWSRSANSANPKPKTDAKIPKTGPATIAPADHSKRTFTRPAYVGDQESYSRPHASSCGPTGIGTARRTPHASEDERCGTPTPIDAVFRTQVGSAANISRLLEHSLSPLRGWFSSRLNPTACVVGCIPSPLRRFAASGVAEGMPCYLAGVRIHS